MRLRRSHRVVINPLNLGLVALVPPLSLRHFWIDDDCQQR